MDAAPWEALCQRGDQRFGLFRVVRHVEDDRRLCCKQLHSSRNRKLGEPPQDRVAARAQSLPELLQNGDRVDRVGALEDSQYRQRRHFVDLDDVARVDDRRADLCGVGLDNRGRRIRNLPQNQRYARLCDAGLFEGDRLDCRAEDLRVIVADRSNCGDQRLQNVRTVEPAAQSHLDHGHVDPFFRKVRKRQGEQRLVIRGTPVL